jgi:hypothetical protein
MNKLDLDIVLYCISQSRRAFNEHTRVYGWAYWKPNSAAYGHMKTELVDYPGSDNDTAGLFTYYPDHLNEERIAILIPWELVPLLINAPYRDS